MDLVAELITDLAATQAPTPDTGTLEDDLVQLLTEVSQILRLRSVTSILRAVMTLADDDVEARRARDRFWQDRFTRSGVIVERAVQRGELPDDTHPQRYLETVFGPLYLRQLVLGQHLDEDDLRSIARRDTTGRP